jgi:maleylpyruvate isomerase
MFRDLDLGARLGIVRDGTTHVVRQAAALSEADLEGPSLLDGWTRRHLVGHLAYNAAALRRLLVGAERGVPAPMYASADQRAEEIESCAGLDAGGLIELLNDQVDQLDAAWRWLPASAWTTEVRTPEGKAVPASETLWMRTREVWIHAVDLDTGTAFEAIPVVVQSTLFADVISGWRAAGASVDVAGAAPGSIEIGIGSDFGTEFSVGGRMPGLLRWMTGRGAEGVVPPDAPPPPKWL